MPFDDGGAEVWTDLVKCCRERAKIELKDVGELRSTIERGRDDAKLPREGRQGAARA